MPPEYQKWVLKLLGYDFETQHRFGPKNKLVAALLRVTVVAHLASLTTPCLIDIEVTKAEVHNDPKLAAIWGQLQENPTSVPKFFIHQGTLCYKGRLVLPKTSSFIFSILQKYHDSVLGGYSNFF